MPDAGLPSGGTVALVTGFASGLSRSELPHPPHELVERALAAAVAGEPNAPQDLGARKVGLLVQPLRDLRRVLHHDRRPSDAAGRAALDPPHLTGVFHSRTHGRTPSQI